jgi:Fe2+ transport system protein FeoA
LARRLYDGGVSDIRPARHRAAAGLLTAAAGTALLIWFVWKAGPGEIWNGFLKVGWGLAVIVLLGGLRFGARAAAWVLCIEPPHRLPFLTAFNAVVSGDAIGNVTPFGPLVGEPAKIACVRGHVAIGPALAALATESVIYSLSVAAMIAAGTIALLWTVELPLRLREFSEIAVGAIAAIFIVAAWVLWKRPAIVSTWLPARWLAVPRLAKLRTLEQEVLTFASRRTGALLPLVALELSFHALGVLEKHLTLWLILGAAPALMTSFIVETADRLITVAFKFVPFQVGVGEAGTGLITQLLGMGAAPGVTVSIVRKARMGIWSLVGTGLLVRRGLSQR